MATRTATPQASPAWTASRKCAGRSVRAKEQLMAQMQDQAELV
jgi:hypothetical protein